MRIVLDLQGAQSHSRHRGIGRYSLSMAKAFAAIAKHHEVWLALNGLHGETAASLIQQFEGLVPRERIAISALPGNIAGCNHGNRDRIALAGAAYSGFLAGLRPDCVWHSSLFEGWGDDSIATLGGGIDDGRHVATFYDLIPLLNPQRYLHDPSYARWYYGRLGLLKRCGLLLAISESSRQEAIEHLQFHAGDIVVVSGAPDRIFRQTQPDAIRWARWKMDWNLRPNFILYSGGYDRHKNVDALIAAYSDLPPDLRNRHPLLLAGRCEASEMKRLEALGQRYRLTRGSLIFSGVIGDDDLVRLYSSCALFIAPSLHEGLGLPPLEAMACGAVVIGSNSSSLPEVIGNAQALFDPFSRSSIAGKLLEVLTDAALAERLRDHAPRQVAKFDWAKSAATALDVIERQLPPTLRARPARPRLLYVSPLPPVRSGIADYSSALLRELAKYYEIELVLDQSELMDTWAEANFPVHSARCFAGLVDDETRVLYHMGNSPYHAYMFAMLGKYPGVVVLHDSWLGAARNWMADQAAQPNLFFQQLYASHGYSALQHDFLRARSSTLNAYPVNLDVLQNAEGLIVHSNYAVEQARRHYGPAAAAKFKMVPFPKAPTYRDRKQARISLGLSPDDLVVCSFGMLAPTKLNHRLLDAWLRSTLANDAHCHLFFVGENDGGEYGRLLLESMAESIASKRIHITGFTTIERYADYLAASDVAVQLRTSSRGETSAAIFDVLSMGIPLIVNAHGSASELPVDVVISLPDHFDDGTLIEALQRVRKDIELRAILGTQARRWITDEHLPATVANDYHHAIEDIFTNVSNASNRRLFARAERHAAAAAEPMAYNRDEWRTVLAANRPRLDRPRIYVDVTAIEKSRLHTGIERVVRGVLLELFELDQTAYRIEPVKLVSGRYRHATEYTLGLLALSGISLEETEVIPHAGDILLGLDWVADLVPANQVLLDDWRVRGVRILFVVYDLLPVQMPAAFPQVIAPMHEAWLQAIGRHADGLLCISKCVADDVRDWFNRHPPQRKSDLALGYFYPGSDIVATRPSTGVPTNASAQIQSMQAVPTFLMVGTVEPRKGHALVLDAFDSLWSQGFDANLVIVGRHGWMSEKLSKRLRTHSKAGEKLHWLEQVSDEYLDTIYNASVALIAASEAEGFGLPLVEASQRGLPVIARDIPVFREVAGTYPAYFDGHDVSSLAAALRQATLGSACKVPSSPLSAPSWQATTGQVWRMLFDKDHSQWLPTWKVARSDAP